MLKEQQMAEGSSDINIPMNAANEKLYEMEPKEKLVEALLPGLTYDKIIGMMNVRKGRVSINYLSITSVTNQTNLEIHSRILSAV